VTTDMNRTYNSHYVVQSQPTCTSTLTQHHT
jgi:hypothetical protein